MSKSERRLLSLTKKEYEAIIENIIAGEPETKWTQYLTDTIIDGKFEDLPIDENGRVAQRIRQRSTEP